MDTVTIRKAIESDIPDIMDLLIYIAQLHHDGRPDIFKDKGSSKYTENDLIDIISCENTPVFVADDGSDHILGYAFCIVKETRDHILLCDRKVLYLDDLCVSITARGKGIGRKLLEKVKSHAQAIDANAIELNVWNFNKSAVSFYEHCGFDVLKSMMELKL